MAITLRDNYTVNTGNDEARLMAEEAAAANMGSLRRGYEAGRIGGDINATNIDEAALRANGRTAEADALAVRRRALEQRQAMYAPEVGRVEDIGGLRDALSWGGTQLGSGVASMQDPVALAAGAQAIGAPLARAGGTAGLIGKGIQGAGMLGAYGLNQRQMAGEHYGQLREDPTALNALGAQGAYQQANLVGAAGGALDTLLPGMAGRALGGAALRKGAAGMVGRGFGGKTLGGMAMEGGTEVAQGELSRLGLDYANPNRDTSQDASGRLNEFAGGAVGGAPFSAAGAAADIAYGRTARGAELVKEKTGEVVDMAREKAGPAIDAARGKAGEIMDMAREKTSGALDAARGAYEGSKLQEAVDISREKGKSVWERAKDFGEVSREDVRRFTLSQEELDLFDETAPPGADMAAWSQDYGARHAVAVEKRLADLEREGVPEASGFLDGIESSDPVARLEAVTAATEFLKDRHAIVSGERKAATLAAALAETGARAAVKVTGLAAGVAKDVATGARRGVGEALKDSKRNAQGAGFTTLDYDTWKAWKEKNHPTPTSEAGSTHAIQKAVEGRSRLKELRGEAPLPTDPEAAARSRERAALFAEMMAAEAQARRAKVMGHRVDDANGAVSYANYVRSLAYEVNDMADSWGARTAPGTRPTAKDGQQAGVSLSLLDAMAEDVDNVLGPLAPDVVARMAQSAEPTAKPFFDILQERLSARQTSKADRKAQDQALQDQMLALLPQQAQAALRENGGEGARRMQETVQMLARGRVPPAKRREIEKAVGAGTLNRMLSLYGETVATPETTVGEVVDDTGREEIQNASGQLAVTDDGEVDPNASIDDFEKRQAERKTKRNAGPRMYAFHGEQAQSLRTTDGERRSSRNPFEPAKRMSPADAAKAREEAAAAELLGEGGKPVIPNARPRLLRMDAEGAEEGIANKIQQLEKTLGVDRTPENYFRMLKDENKGVGKAKAREALSALEQRYNAGDADAVAEVQDRMDAFFENRAGGYVVNAVSARQVMDELGMPPSQRLAIFRDYMFQEGQRTRKSDPAASKRFYALARNAQAQLLDGGFEPNRGTAAENADTPTNSGMGVKRNAARLLAGERKTLQTAMERYFNEGYLVAAEQLSDRIPGEMAVGELMEMARSGARARDAVRGIANKSGSDTVSRAAMNELEGSLLNFPQREGVNLMGTKNNVLSVKASNLVNWVRNNRREEGADTKSDGKTKLSEEAQFLRDLKEGIAIVAAMDPVGGLPYVVGPKGEQQFFKGNKVPDALQLPNRSGEMFNKGNDERSSKRAADNQARAKEQAAFMEGSKEATVKAFVRAERDEREKNAKRDRDLTRNEDWFVADPLEGIEDTTKYKTFEEPTSGTAGTSPYRRRTTFAEHKLDGAHEAINREANRDAADVSPLDTRLFLDKGQAEYDAQKLRSKDAGDGVGRESAMDAVKEAADRAGSVVAYKGKAREVTEGGTLTRVDRDIDARATLTNIQRRVVAAKLGTLKGRTDLSPKEAQIAKKYEGFASGKHYAYPLAHALSVKNVQDLLNSGAFSPAQMDFLVDQQRMAAEIINTAPMGARLQLAKAMMDGRGDVANYGQASEALAALAKGVNYKRAASEVAAAGAPKSQPSRGGAPEHAVAKATQGRKLSLLSTQVHNDLQRPGFAATHDSPIKHEGKFDWRANLGKGDGNSIYGAGTYLSTDDVIHRGYKGLFSLVGQRTTDADGTVRRARGTGTPSPTYHVSVGIMPSQILVWEKPLSEQSGLVRRKLQAAGFTDQDKTGAEIYRALAKRLGSDAAASNHLQSLGILGHEYGRVGKRLPNFVIYDDSKIETNYVHFNQQKVNEDPAPSDAQVNAAKAYLNKVLGPQIKAEFEAMTGYSGEFIEAENVVRISTLTNAGVMNVARHEALHAFFAKFVKANPKAVKTLASLTDDERVLRRLQALLKDEPAALAQLTDGEERLAYIYQFAMAGQLKLPHTPGATLMHKIRKFLRRVFQMVSDQERAVDLLYAFEHGKMSQPSAAARAVAAAIDQGTWATKGARQIDGFAQWAAGMVLPASTILGESVSPTARALAKTLFSNPGEEGSSADAPGYLNERNQQMRRYDNLFRKAVDDLDKRQLDELTEAMQQETPTDQVRDPDVAQAKERLHALFERFHRYMTEEKGLRIGKINESYFPVVYDPDKVRKDMGALLLGKYQGEMEKMAASISRARAEGAPAVSAEDVAEAIVVNISRVNPLDDADLEPQRQDGVLRPWFASGEKRILNFLSPEDRARFQEKDIITTMSRYVRQGVRTAEYTSRFGRDGVLLDKQLKDIKSELVAASRQMLAAGDLKDEKAREKWAKRQYRDVANAVGGIEGSLGHDVSDTVRKINSAAIVYQNVRLLPLALFSSFVDPLGIVARGGEMKEAFTTFTEGIKGVARQWANSIREEPADRQKDRWEELAEHAGIIDAATFSHLLADEYGSVYLDGRAKKINEFMFKANGMEAWNRAMRVGATRAAVRFMERHNKNPDAHSERWMRDLGFEPGTLPLDSEGRLITDKRVMLTENPDMSMEQAEALIAQVHRGLNRWVEGAILSPNAAQRPAWGSDPHYSMFWHLKQFAYSFHETIMKRAFNEAKQGNVMPLGVFAWYIPTMIAADVTKGLMLGAGELPAYMKGYDLGDWMLHGVDRAGVLGIGQVAIDTAQDPLGLAGPAVEQITEIFTESAQENIVKALPVNALYSRALL